MPSIEITLPKTDDCRREQLALRLTDAVIETTGFERESLGIIFHEYQLSEASMGGKLWKGDGLPFLHLVLYCPRLRRAVKQKLVENLSQTFAACVQHEDWLPTIHISEHAYDNIGWKGALLSDTYEELAKRKFYYELPKD
jgi:phenylpyruvate tautomerase PptA (4-oxalocrotonate tautomerase family)